MNIALTQNPHTPTFGTPPIDGQVHHRNAVYAVIRDKGRIAVVRTPRGYFLPGGGIEEHESVVEALIRELFEELGWAINIHSSPRIARQYHYSEAQHRNYLTVAHFYDAEFDAELCEPYEEDHHLEWLTLEEAEDKLYTEAMKWALK